MERFDELFGAVSTAGDGYRVSVHRRQEDAIGASIHHIAEKNAKDGHGRTRSGNAAVLLADEIQVSDASILQTRLTQWSIAIGDLLAEEGAA